MADDTPQTTPQPNGIRLVKPAGVQPTIRLKPIVPRPAAPAAPAAPEAAPVAPAAPAAPAAGDVSTPTVRLKPITPMPRPAASTVNLKPTPAPAPAPAPEEDLSATIQISAPPPVTPTGGGIKPVAPLRPVAPTPAVAVKSEQLQASKSKTSRISLDAAIAASGESNGPRTIRIKRPTDAPVGKLTSQIPPVAPAADTPAAPEGEVPLAQRRTIRVKRPAGPAAPAAPQAEADGAEAAADGVTPPEFATDVPPPAFSVDAAGPVEKTSAIFPILGIVATILFGVTIFFLMRGDANLFNPALWPVPR